MTTFVAGAACLIRRVASESVHAGHHQIHQHDARGVLEHEGHGGLPISRFSSHAHTGLGVQERAEQPAEVDIVFDHQNVR